MPPCILSTRSESIPASSTIWLPAISILFTYARFDKRSSTLKKMSASFARVQLWKQWKKLQRHSTEYIDGEELKNHCLALKLLEKILTSSKPLQQRKSWTRKTTKYNIF
jgi:hypothetical protein